MRLSKLVQVVVVLALSISAQAGDLRAPFDFESTAVLPKGIRNPRVKNLVLFMDTKFGAQGNLEPLGQKLNKAVTWNDVVDGQDDDTLKAITAGKVQSLDMRLDGIAGYTSGVVNTYANVTVPVLAYGVTSNFTLALAVPVMNIEWSVDTGLVKTSDGDALIASVCESDPDKCQESASKLNDAINTKLRRYGYEEIASGNRTAIGDIKLVGKHLAWNDERNAVAVKTELTLPTGVAPDVNRALDTPTGDGQTDLGFGLVYDRFLTADRALKANAYAGYTIQFADEIAKRLPKSSTDSLSPDIEVLERNLGDSVSAGAALTYQFDFGLNVGAGYGFQYLNKASYNGTKYPAYRYRLLEQDTAQRLHSAMVGIGFSSVDLFKRGKFIAPLQMNVAYSKPLAGMNTVQNDFMAFEMVLFF